MTDFLMVPPPRDGLQRAMATARRRRLRTASVTTGLGASLALVVPLLLGSGSQAAQLIPAPDVNQPAVVVVPTDVPAPAVDTTIQVAGPQAAGGPGRLAAPTVTRASAGAQPVHDRTTPGGSPLRPYSAGPIGRTDDRYGEEVCLPGSSGTGATGPCTSAYAGANQDKSQTLTAYLCNVGASATRVPFAGRNEVDFTVTTAKGAAVWKWSTWHRDDRSAHTLTVEPGACTRWEFGWTQVDAAGRALPAGSYQLDVDFLSKGLTRQSASFTIG